MKSFKLRSIIKRLKLLEKHLLCILHLLKVDNICVYFRGRLIFLFHCFCSHACDRAMLVDVAILSVFVSGNIPTNGDMFLNSYLDVHET